MQKFNRGLELFWLFFTIIVAIFCIYAFATDGVTSGKYYLLFLILPLMMYLFRRFVRKRMEKTDENDKSRSNKNSQ